MSSTRANLIFALLVILITALGSFLRIWNVEESLWVDELHTSWVVEADLGDLWHRSASGNQSPLYYVLTWCVVQLFGESELSLRVVALGCGLLFVPLIASIVFRITAQRSIAVCACLFAAIDVDLVFFSHEARPYSMLILLSLIHIWMTWVLFTPSKKERLDSGRSIGRFDANRIIWIVSLVAAFYTHFSAIYLIMIDVGLLLGLLINGVRIERNRFVASGIDLLMAGLLLLPMAPLMFDILGRRSDWSDLVQHWPLPWQLVRPIAVYLFPGIVVGIALIIARWKRRRASSSREKTLRTNSRLAMVCLMAFLGSICCIWAVSRAVAPGAFLTRYLLMFLPLAMLFLVAVFASVRRPAVRIILLGGLLVFEAIENPMLNEPWPMGMQSIQRNENWRDALSQIHAMRQPGESVYLFPNLVEDHRIGVKPDLQRDPYFQFPVEGIYREATSDSVADSQSDSQPAFLARSTTLPPHWTNTDISTIRPGARKVLLIRGTLETVDQIISELDHRLGDQPITFDTTVDVYGSLFVVELSFVVSADTD